MSTFRWNRDFERSHGPSDLGISSGKMTRLIARTKFLGLNDGMDLSRCVHLCLANGILGALACFTIVLWVNHTTLDCPVWALECQVSGGFRIMVAGWDWLKPLLCIALNVSLALIFYACHTRFSTALNSTGIVTQSPFQKLSLTDSGINRGSPSLVWRSFLYGVAVAIHMQLVSHAMGHSLGLTEIPTRHFSSHPSGGGVHYPFTQSMPPGSRPGAVDRAGILYESWALGLTSEPMPEQRHFLVDRANLSEVGQVTIRAAKVLKDVAFFNISLDLDDRPVETSADRQVGVTTRLGGSVNIRVQPAMTVWVAETGICNATSAWATLVFANLGGLIESSGLIIATDAMIKREITTVSAIASNITVNLVNDVFCIGPCRIEESTAISLLETLLVPKTQKSDRHLEISDIALWLAVSPSVYGSSIHGAQPMWTKSSRHLHGSGVQYPRFYTSYRTDFTKIDWSLRDIAEFIDICVGALATMIPTSSSASKTQNVTVTSMLPTQRRDPRRSYLVILLLMYVPISSLILARLGL